jgi:hypothetical protein
MDHMDEVLFQSFREFIENREKNRKASKTIPAKKEWTKMFKEYEELCEAEKTAQKKMQIKRKFLWATIETDLGDNSDMRFTDDGTEVEILEDFNDSGKKGKGIKSPFVAM